MQLQPLVKILIFALPGLFYASANAAAARFTQPLDGRWQIADGKSPDAVPSEFNHTVPVPGLANLAQPAFPAVDAFISRENLANRVRAGLVPADWLTNYWTGKVDQDRDYFWYHKTFRAPAARAVALLKINKAQFGTAVWLNGQKLGEYAGCFTASYFRLNEAIRWEQENTLVIRIGAHPAVLPDTYPTGSDFEKIKWTPGIYDSVSLIFCDNPVIASIQVAPRLASSEITIQTTVKNYAATPAQFNVSHSVKSWSDGRALPAMTAVGVRLEPGEEKTVTQKLALPGARLWTPEDPFLYVLRTLTPGDEVLTRFGMREFRFDAATGRAYLNGQIYYLRGSNITLHRFFEDPLCQDLPWNDAWVRKLLSDLPKKMHWNYFRFCIGPVPDRWLEICDEFGLLIQNEFFVWTGKPEWYPGYSRKHDPDAMIRQYRDWMRDNWNHPSVVVWDANNETLDPIFGERILPAVRPLDLSNRPWENSYNPPVGPNDPVEHHPYLMSGGFFGELKFQLTDLETMDARPTPGTLPSDNHPVVINEYGWLWLNRDGSPTRLTEKVYAQLMGPNVTPRERLDRYAYLLGAKTEYWRAARHYAGIIHFVYLTCSYPGVYTADHFSDVTKLELDPAFADYVGEAFKPLGVYINFFQPTLPGGSTHEFTVQLLNDEPRPLHGQLTLTLETKAGKVLARSQQGFNLPESGAQTCQLRLDLPRAAGEAVLKAIAHSQDKPASDATISRRWVTVTE